MVPTPKDKLKDIVNQGVKIDIFDAEEAIKLYEVIGNYKEKLVKDNFDNLFGVFQIALIKNTILAINKIYEEPKNKYQLRSLPDAVKILKDNCNDLKIEYREQLEEKLTNWGFDKKCLISLSDSELTNIVAEALSTKLPSQDEIKDIKDVRDKRVAHHEFIDETKISSIMWPHLEDLLERAKKIVGVIGNHYLGSFYENNDGEYVFSSEVSKTSRSLVRLFQKAGIVN
ncbi:AbiU2 domain-containing protein [Nostoc sp.]|uniref:AbiU2 domain-containing protein n=1 Tax=Nostoc sp. TaxID=1180 RepID=UPI002FFBEC86